MKIVHPTLLIDEQRCRANIRFMAEKVANHNLEFKPHFKTHQSREIGTWFRDAGVTGITVSSIAMAEYFAKAGWDDITIAFPANILAIDQLNHLAEKIKLTLLLDNDQTLRCLGTKLDNIVDILIEINAGSNRTGVDVEDHKRIQSLVKQLDGSDKLNFKGFYSHFGHTYGSKGEEDVLTKFESSLKNVNQMMSSTGFRHMNLHIGDTPGCSLASNFQGITTLTPGNFVFFDVMQLQIGSCNINNIAVAVTCPVVSKNANRKEIIIHGGAVHFSKESIILDEKPCYGLMVEINEDGIGELADGKIIALSQEHGILKVEDQLFEKIKIGDVVGILPIHSCLTAECFKGYTSLEANKELDHM